MTLSKSRYLSGRQCAKRLWIETHRPELLPPTDVATQAIFDQGHAVGELARELFPGGVEIDRTQLDWASARAATREAMLLRVPLYEPAFEHEGAACRVDILVPVEAPAGSPFRPGAAGSWDLYEVKSGSSPKPENVEDVAFQAFVLRGAGATLRRTHLVHLNSSYERQGALEVQRLFTVVDLTATIEPAVAAVATRVAELRAVWSRSEEPQVAIGPHCDDPHNCALIPYCWSGIPEASVFTLTRAGRKKWELFARGVIDLAAIPDDFHLTGPQQIQVLAARRGEPHIDLFALRGFLSTLAYPLYCIDFETFTPAVPPFSGTRPYQAIPFQFSAHVIDRPGAEPRAAAFLAADASDRREEFLDELRRALGELEEGGTLLAFNASFERARIAELAALFPENAAWAERVKDSFVDLLLPFRNFDYYHPAQLGRASLKNVLPVLGTRGYEHLEIHGGEIAARDFVRSTLVSTPPEERDRIRAALLEYCGRDTEGMVEIVAALERLVAQ